MNDAMRLIPPEEMRRIFFVRIVSASNAFFFFLEWVFAENSNGMLDAGNTELRVLAKIKKTFEKTTSRRRPLSNRSQYFFMFSVMLLLVVATSPLSRKGP